jgi:hypothetical protein
MPLLPFLKGFPLPGMAVSWLFSARAIGNSRGSPFAREMKAHILGIALMRERGFGFSQLGQFRVGGKDWARGRITQGRQG